MSLVRQSVSPPIGQSRPVLHSPPPPLHSSHFVAMNVFTHAIRIGPLSIYRAVKHGKQGKWIRITHLLRGMLCISRGRSHRVSICKAGVEKCTCQPMCSALIQIPFRIARSTCMLIRHLIQQSAAAQEEEEKKKEETHPVTNTVFSRWMVDMFSGLFSSGDKS